jgi:meso-butanediol dehydrogenase / (S,S)-butanediol dehydrogenase / diacetyl reductase
VETAEDDRLGPTESEAHRSGLAGRVAVVTGAGSGIGRAIAAELARRGARTWCADREADAARASAAALGSEAAWMRVDVTRRDELEALRDRVFEVAGRADVVVANAGVSTMNRFLDLSDDEWDTNFAVNARGAFLTVQTFARAMVDQPVLSGRATRGTIVVTGSMAARVAAPLLAHYSASKFAVVGLVQAVAKELGPLGITVNGVNPGFVRTSMQEREVEWEARLRSLSPDAVRADYVAQTPLGRLQEPEDVARVVAFLASDDAAFITGELIEVNGGAATI